MLARWTHPAPTGCIQMDFDPKLVNNLEIFQDYRRGKISGG